MRVLHVVKTSDGASWAAEQALQQVRRGLEVHVALPSSRGDCVKYWEAAGATMHVADLSLPLRNPQRLGQRLGLVRQIVEDVSPDIIHSHFVTTTVFLRLALGKTHRIPRIFQVPGPLHLEHRFFRLLDIKTSGSADYWIASSQYIYEFYRRHGVSSDRLSLSYYGTNVGRFVAAPDSGLRARYRIPASDHVVGNVSFMYPPKYYLGQTTGLKRHEDLIQAIDNVCAVRPNVTGLVVGGQWGKGTRYEARLRRLAERCSHGRVVMAGRLGHSDAAAAWNEIDCAVHVPISENCGGVVEPLVYGKPTIASKVGGLPEVVIPGFTGWLVPPKQPAQLAEAILEVIDDPAEGQRRAAAGQELVLKMFDVERTAAEVVEVYERALDSDKAMIQPFDSLSFVSSRTNRLNAKS